MLIQGLTTSINSPIILSFPQETKVAMPIHRIRRLSNSISDQINSRVSHKVRVVKDPIWTSICQVSQISIISSRTFRIWWIICKISTLKTFNSISKGTLLTQLTNNNNSIIMLVRTLTEKMKVLILINNILNSHNIKRRRKKNSFLQRKFAL